MDPQTLDARRVLVTGGAGFVGGHLVRRLAGDHEVRVLDDLSSGDRRRVPASASLTVGDVRDAAVVDEAVEDVDVVFHQAAEASVPASIDAPVRSHEVNVDGTLAVLEAARRHDARVVLASSAAVYGHPERIPVREGDAKEPTSPYGIQKLATDQYARRYHELYGLETVTLRYFNVYGPRREGGGGVVQTFLEQALSGGPLTIEGDGSQTRDFVHVSDVVDANVLAARGATSGEAFNVGTGRATSIRDLATAVTGAVGETVPVEHVPPRDGDVTESVAAVDRAAADFGFEASVTLEDGLADLVARADDTGD